MINFIFIILLSFFTTTSFAGPVASFSHENHIKGAFKTMQFDCSGCHNFSMTKGEIKAEAGLANSALKADYKTLCHQCHNTKESRFKAVPQECVICHGNTDSAKNIKPLNHQNAAWKRTHALNAKTTGASCLNCHIQADCLKCHLRRNDVEMVNHSRNFRFTHSVEARVQPHRCEACHTQNYCVKCHVGR